MCVPRWGQLLPVVLAAVKVVDHVEGMIVLVKQMVSALGMLKDSVDRLIVVKIKFQAVFVDQLVEIMKQFRRYPIPVLIVELAVQVIVVCQKQFQKLTVLVKLILMALKTRQLKIVIGVLQGLFIGQMCLDLTESIIGDVMVLTEVLMLPVVPKD